MIANGGYPITLRFEVQSADTLKFVIDLRIGLRDDILLSLNTTWRTQIQLFLLKGDDSEFVVSPRRSLQLQNNEIEVPLSNAEISNEAVTLFTNAIDPHSLVGSSQFRVQFATNLISANNTIYSIWSANTTDSAPWELRRFFELNRKPFYLISVLFFAAAVIPLLMRVRNGYHILVEYFQCLQLAGLTLFSLYPFATSVDLFSFVSGLDFANFSFMYNVPVHYIPVCTDCSSLSGYAFVLGDMNWLKIIGALLICFAILLLLIVLTYAFVISREYAKFLVKLTVDLVLIKCIQAWFASLVYAGLNLHKNEGNSDTYITLMHILSYAVLIPLLYIKARNSRQDRYPISSEIFLVVHVCLVSVLSVGPMVMCSLLMFTVSLEWCFHMFNKFIFTKKGTMDFGQGEDSHNFIVDGQVLSGKGCNGLLPDIYFHVLHSLRPMTAFLIACIMMIDQTVAIITFVSLTTGLYLLIILLLIYCMYRAPPTYPTPCT